jgi:hypothetical protein
MKVDVSSLQDILTYLADDAKHVGLRILTFFFFFFFSFKPSNNLHAHNTEFQHIHAPS